MKKAVVYFMGAILVASVLFYNYSYVKFTPLTFDPKKRTGFVELAVDPSFNTKLISVLKNYNLDYKVIDQQIYIKRKVANNRELVWNCTIKALDREWLRSH